MGTTGSCQQQSCLNSLTQNSEKEEYKAFQ